MEDEHVMIDNFCGNKSQGFFAVYDGHGGRGTVEYVSKNLHEILKKHFETTPEIHPLEAIKKTFNETDKQIAEQKNNVFWMYSCCCFNKNRKGK